MNETGPVLVQLLSDHGVEASVLLGQLQGEVAATAPNGLKQLKAVAGEDRARGILTWFTENLLGKSPAEMLAIVAPAPISVESQLAEVEAKLSKNRFAPKEHPLPQQVPDADPPPAKEYTRAELEKMLEKHMQPLPSAPEVAPAAQVKTPSVGEAKKAAESELQRLMKRLH